MDAHDLTLQPSGEHNFTMLEPQFELTAQQNFPVFFPGKVFRTCLHGRSNGCDLPNRPVRSWKRMAFPLNLQRATNLWIRWLGATGFENLLVGGGGVEGGWGDLMIFLRGLSDFIATRCRVPFVHSV